MEQSPSWEGNRFGFSQEIPLVLWNPKVRNRVRKRPPPVPILSQLDPVRTPAHLLKIRFNIIFPPMSGFSKWSLSLRFPNQNPVYTSSLPYTCNMPKTSHSYRFDLPKNVEREYRSLSSSLYSFLHSPVTSSPLGPNILLSTLFSDALNLRSSLRISHQVSHS